MPTKSPDLAKPTRLIDYKDIRCPAGDTARAGTAVRCKIEHSTISAYLDPSSVQGFCCGNYQSCPTWLAEKARIDAKQTGSLIEDPGNKVIEAA